MRKLAFVVLAVFGLVSVSFGAWIPEDVEKNYQKLKAEMEMYDLVDFEKRCYTGDLDHIKNVIAFFDEIRAMEVTKKQASRWGICFGEKKNGKLVIKSISYK